jgi:gamma-glutamyltranspeptidase / glutathione hydrolase
MMPLYTPRIIHLIRLKMRRHALERFGGHRRWLAAAATLLLLSSCTKSVPLSSPRASMPPGKRVEARRGLVAASSADAAAAGLAVLERGGNAIDAAVATAFALGVVDHSQTGIGGYGIATVWLAKERRAAVFEFMGRTGADPAWGMTDPATTGPVNSRLAIVPGFVSGLLAMHARHGVLSRADVLAPAIRLARDGFTVGPLMHRVLAAQREKVAVTRAAAVFLPNGEVPALGDRLVQTELASVLEAISREGADAFYKGEYARKTAEEIRAAGGLLTEADFAAYTPVERRPACSEFSGHRVLGAAGASAGPYVIEMLNVAEASGVHTLGDPTATPRAAARLADALSVGVQDLRRYGGNPEWRPSPVRGVTSDEYAGQRAIWNPKVSDSGSSAPDAWAHERAAPAATCSTVDPYPVSTRPTTEAVPDQSWDSLSATNTSHLSVIDANRNVVSLTSSIGVLFGSGVYAGGMFLNSSGNLFRAGTRAPNRSPSSSVSPMIVMQGDLPRLAVGAAGAAYIPGAVAQVILRVAGLKQDLYAALSAPRMNPTATGGLEIEAGFALPVYQELRAHGYAPSTRIADLMFAAVHAIAVREDGMLIGAADPRRDGAAAGY